MRKYDRAPAILSAFVEDDAEMLAHPPDDPKKFAREFVEAAEPWKPTPKPCPCTRDWRRQAWEDFCIRRGVLLLSMAYESLSHDIAIELLHDLQLRLPKVKHRSFSAMRDVWIKRDKHHEPHAWSTRDGSPGDQPYLTRADYLILLVGMIHNDERLHKARHARAIADSPIWEK